MNRFDHECMGCDPLVLCRRNCKLLHIVGKFQRGRSHLRTPMHGVTKVALEECVGNRFSSAVQTRVSELVQRARYPTPALVQHMGVDHRGRNVGVAEQLLHRADVVTAFEQVSGK